METDDIIYPLFQCPGSLLINGGSFSGKTSLLCRILIHRDKLFSKTFQNIVYCYAENHTLISTNVNGVHLHLHHGFPNQETLDEWLDNYDESPWLLALDDMARLL